MYYVTFTNSCNIT